MKTETIIQTIGGVAKEETVFSLTNHVMPNTFVLENDEPYPYYHGDNLPKEPKPYSVFLMTKNRHSTESVLRMSSNIRKYLDQKFDAVPGVICIYNETLPCIRLRDIDNYEIIGELQKSFFAEGVGFMKKRNVKALAVIQLKKLFTIKKIEEGIYLDLDDTSMFYIKIPRQLPWRLFAQVSQRVRDNVDKEDANFDAALAAIYTKEILDVARIYAKNINVEKLQLIKEKYEYIISRID